MTNMVGEVGQATYTDPTTAGLVAAGFRAIPLLRDRQADQVPAWQLKISEPNSLRQSPMACQLRCELEAISPELAPPPERTSDAMSHSPTGKQEEPATVPLPVPENPEPPASPPPLRQAPALLSAEHVAHPPGPLSGGGNEVLPRSGGSPTTDGPGPF